MITSKPVAHGVRAKTAAVVDYHHDESQPGKPLHLLIPGGLIALAALGMIIYVAYRTWFDGTLTDSQAWLFLAALTPAYVVGVFMFSYGYELYDMPKTIRLTLIIVVLTVAAVLIVAVLFALLGESGSGSSSSSKSSSSSSGSSSKSSSSSSSSGGGAAGSYLGESSTSPNASSSTGYSRPSYGGMINPIFLDNGGGSVTHEVTHEVVREVPVSPPPPQPISCPFCGRSYIPTENKFACPACGAATPTNLLPADTGS